MQVERRFHPRIAVSFPVNIFTENSSQSFTASSSNISLSGIQISVCKETIDCILNWGNYPLEFFIAFSDAGIEITELKVRLIVNRRISNQHYALGLKFLQISNEQQQKLAQLIDRHSR